MDATAQQRPDECVLLHYSEIGLKGRNRPHFISQLAGRVVRAVETCGGGRVYKRTGRLILEPAEGAEWERVREALGRVFGLAYFARARRLPLDLERAAEVALEMIAPLRAASFRVRTRKSFDTTPISSREWDRTIGARIQARRHLPVSLNAPELTVRIEALPREALLFTEKVPGPGGLPIGSSGRVTALLSGGIDSPVAVWRMMKRGCEVAFVHFHGAPYLGRASVEKAQDLAEVLDGYQLGSRLYVVPFGELQKRIVLSTKPDYRVVLYRRFMARIAERIARMEKAHALVTGESLGQVASQTLQNLATIEEAVTMPILRPLIAMDKEEIIAEAQRLGTFEISIEPDQDCCSLFVPKHPAIRSRAYHLRGIEGRLPVEEMIESALEGTEVVTFEEGKKRTSVSFKTFHSALLPPQVLARHGGPFKDPPGK